MAKMSKAQARKRLSEALMKVKAVYVSSMGGQKPISPTYGAVSTADMAAVEKVISKCMNRLR
jgi:hypothetical protein